MGGEISTSTTLSTNIAGVLAGHIVICYVKKICLPVIEQSLYYYVHRLLNIVLIL